MAPFLPDAGGDALGGLLVALALEFGEQLVEPFGLGLGCCGCRLFVAGAAVGSAAMAGERAAAVRAAAQKAKRIRMRGNLFPRMETSN